MSKNLARGENYSFRVNGAEKRFLDKKIKKSGMGRREYFLLLARDEQLVEYSNIEFLKELFVEIKKEGVNLNQIAKELNSKQHEEKLSKIQIKRLNRILEHQEELFEKISDEMVQLSLKGK